MDQRIRDQAKYHLHAHLTGLDQIPKFYLKLVKLTEVFAESVKQIAFRLPENFNLNTGLLVDFAVYLLHTSDSSFKLMLNSQRAHIFRILDDAHLSICLDEWEKLEVTTRWPRFIHPATKRLGIQLLAEPNWLDDRFWDQYQYQLRCLNEQRARDIALGSFPFPYDNAFPHSTPNYSRQKEPWSSQFWYFKRSRAFLQESTEIYNVRTKVNACLQRRLPREIAEIIIEDVLADEIGTVGNLRSKYLPTSSKR